METFRVPRERSKAPSIRATEVEHRGFRKLLGQLQWACRMLFYEESFETSARSSELASPCIRDIQRANAAVRRIKATPKTKMIFNLGFDVRDLGIICVSDSALDNLNHRSHRGHILLLGEGEMVRNHAKRGIVHTIAWQSSRI